MARITILEAVELAEEIKIRSAFNSGQNYSKESGKFINKLNDLRELILFPPDAESDKQFRSESERTGAATWEKLKAMFRGSNGNE